MSVIKTYEIPLVTEIHKRPCLYNYNLPEYNRKEVLDKSWLEVSAIVGLNVHECKDKWKNIRSSFVRSLRNNSTGKFKKPYYLSQYLDFIIPYLNLRPANLDVNLPLESNETTSLHEEKAETLIIKIEPKENEHMDPLHSVDEVEIPEVPLKRKQNILKRRRLIPVKNQIRNKVRRQFTPLSRENNAIKCFLLSLMPELDAMDESQIRMFKIKVMMLIHEIRDDDSKVRSQLSGSAENIALQKQLIKLLTKNLENDFDD